MSGLLTVCSKKMVMTINGNDHMMNLSMVVFTNALPEKKLGGFEIVCHDDDGP
jgi:hypothetical protein